MDNVERLHQAGLIKDPSQLDAEAQRKLNSLTTEEVETLIAVDQKLGWSKGSDYCFAPLGF